MNLQDIMLSRRDDIDTLVLSETCLAVHTQNDHWRAASVVYIAPSTVNDYQQSSGVREAAKSTSLS